MHDLPAAELFLGIHCYIGDDVRCLVAVTDGDANPMPSVLEYFRLEKCE